MKMWHKDLCVFALFSSFLENLQPIAPIFYINPRHEIEHLIKLDCVSIMHDDHTCPNQRIMLTDKIRLFIMNGQQHLGCPSVEKFLKKKASAINMIFTIVTKIFLGNF